VTKSLPILALIATAGALALVGCGGSNDESNSGGAYGSGNNAKSTATTTAGGASQGSATFVSVASVPGLGRVLVDSKGFTLYDFHKDKGDKSSCYGGCAQVWPPLTTSGKPQPSNGASASKLGTTKRSDGTVQVTYAGHPLYTYTADTKPGDAKGNDFSSFGGEWYALQPSGSEP
jgi:predicted lipoprotein with Yx(FWY)xxD motif